MRAQSIFFLSENPAWKILARCLKFVYWISSHLAMTSYYVSDVNEPIFTNDFMSGMYFFEYSIIYLVLSVLQQTIFDIWRKIEDERKLILHLLH